MSIPSQDFIEEKVRLGHKFLVCQQHENCLNSCSNNCKHSCQIKYGGTKSSDKCAKLCTLSEKVYNCNKACPKEVSSCKVVVD